MQGRGQNVCEALAQSPKGFSGFWKCKLAEPDHVSAVSNSSKNSCCVNGKGCVVVNPSGFQFLFV